MRGIAVVALLASLSGCATAWARHERPLGVAADATVLASSALIVGGSNQLASDSNRGDLRGATNGLVGSMYGLIGLGVGVALELVTGAAELHAAHDDRPAPIEAAPPPPGDPIAVASFDDVRRDRCADLRVALGRLHAADPAAYQRAVLQPDVAICVSGSRP